MLEPSLRVFLEDDLTMRKECRSLKEGGVSLERERRWQNTVSGPVLHLKWVCVTCPMSRTF